MRSAVSNFPFLREPESHLIYFILLRPDMSTKRAWLWNSIWSKSGQPNFDAASFSFLPGAGYSAFCEILSRWQTLLVEILCQSAALSPNPTLPFHFDLFDKCIYIVDAIHPKYFHLHNQIYIMYLPWQDHLKKTLIND